jgi:hypothetical protein
MLSVKVLVFNKLLKLSFFYRIKKIYMPGANLIGVHCGCLLFNLDKFLYFMYRLTPFFLNVVRKQGIVFFIGVKFTLLKWFKYKEQNIQQELIINWKGGILSNFFNTRLWADSKSLPNLNALPISFIFFNLDNYLTAFKEINKFKLPVIGLFEKSFNPSLIYSFGGLHQSFFVNCFFFKLFSRFLKYLN